MIHRPLRIRRIAKWTGLVVCCLVMVLSAWSHFWGLSWRYDRETFGMHRNGAFYLILHGSGSVSIANDQVSYPRQPPWWSVDRQLEGGLFGFRPERERSGHRYGDAIPEWLIQPPWWSVERHFERDLIDWRPQCGRSGPGFEVVIPEWLLLLAIVLPTGLLFYRDRRPPRGRCQGCGYNLTGNTPATCPVCGAVA